jgi:quercetin dioxygenase-like cupin family protein
MSVDRIQLGGLGTRYLVEGEATGGAYALLEQTLAPGVLAMPPHRNALGDARSYVLEGTLTVWLDGEVSTLGPGRMAEKPRGRAHTVWNAGTGPVRFLELISPPAFAAYYRELGAILLAPGPPDWPALGALAARHGLEMDYVALDGLLERHGLTLG